MQQRGMQTESLAERHHGKAPVCQVLHHLGGVPPVVSDFPYMVCFTQFFDELLDETIMDDVPFRCLDEALLLPDVV